MLGLYLSPMLRWARDTLVSMSIGWYRKPLNSKVSSREPTTNSASWRSNKQEHFYKNACFLLLVTFKQFRTFFFFFFFFFQNSKTFFGVQKTIFNVVSHFSIPHTLYLSYQCVMSTLSLIHHFLSLTSTGVCQFSSLDKAQVSSSGPERLRISKTKLSVEVVSLQIFLSVYSVVSCCSVGTVYPNLGKKEVYYWIRNWIYFDGQRKQSR